MINPDPALIARYERYLIEQPRLRESTRGVYLRDLRQFLEYCESKNIAIEDMDPLGLGQYTVHLYETGWVRGKTKLNLAAATRLRKRSAIRAFYAFLTYEGCFETTPIPFDWYSRMKKPDGIPYFISKSAVGKLVASADLHTPYGLRDRAIIEVLYGAGVTVSELCGINLSDVDFHTNRISVRSGEGQQRWALFGRFAERALRDYLNEGRPQFSVDADAEDPLFVNRQGTRLTRQGVHKVVRKLADKAGLDSRVCARALRHSFSVELLKDHVDWRCVQHLLGHHSSIPTSKLATQINPGSKNDLMKCHPLAKTDGVRARAPRSEVGASDYELLSQPYKSTQMNKRR